MSSFKVAAKGIGKFLVVASASYIANKSFNVQVAVIVFIVGILLLVLLHREELKLPALLTVALIGGIFGAVLFGASWLYMIYHYKKNSPPLSQAKIVTTTPPSGRPTDIAKWRLGNNPDSLILHDLFLIDFDSVQQQSSGSMFVDDAKKISVEYSVNTELALRSKFLSFYIPRHDHTAAICRYLAQQHEFVLDKAPQLLVEQKSPGDSRTISTKEAVFTGRIYVYHETYLPAEETVKLSSFYERLGLSGIFRSTDYRSTKVLEAKVRLAQKVNEAPN